MRPRRSWIPMPATRPQDADLALQELGSDLVGQAYVTATVTVWDEDPRIAEERLRQVEKTIQGRDFTCIRETVNAVEAWLGSLPGHVYANVRQPPISTLNLAHMMPFSAVWAGPAGRTSWGPTPLLRPHRRLNAIPLRAPCGRCRPHACHRPDRRRQKRVARADGVAVPPLRRCPDIRVRFRRLASVPRPLPWAGIGTTWAAPLPTRCVSRSRCSLWRASTIPASALGRLTGWLHCWPAKVSPSPRN